MLTWFRQLFLVEVLRQLSLRLHSARIFEAVPAPESAYSYVQCCAGRGYEAQGAALLADARYWVESAMASCAACYVVLDLQYNYTVLVVET